MNEIYIRKKLEEFLLEDLGHIEIDLTKKRSVRANIITEEDGIFCGGRFIDSVFALLTPIGRSLPKTVLMVGEGENFSKNTKIASFHGHPEILKHGIRTVLNLIQHLSGIATNTRKVVEQVAGLKCKILDTRKTTPGLRVFEKYAVRTGGGYNHRFGRFDGILIKKEDIKLDGGVKRAIEKAFKSKSYLETVEVEVENLKELTEVLKDGRATHVLLDNMDLKTMRQAVKLCNNLVTLEASGVGDKNLREVAETGVQFISTSSLILGAKPIKMKMRIV